MNTYSKKIKELRKNLNMSTGEFSEKINLTSSSISNWESNIHVPSIRNINKIITAFNLPSDYFNDCVRVNNIVDNNIKEDIKEDTGLLILKNKYLRDKENIALQIKNLKEKSIQIDNTLCDILGVYNGEIK